MQLVQQNKMKVGVLIFDKVEELDFVGPFEVFSVAGRKEEKAFFEVFLVAATTSPLNTVGGMRVTPKYSFDTCPSLDILVVPGGIGTRKLVDNAQMIAWIKAVASKSLVLSVCTGALLLGKTGLLDGKKCTTHFKALSLLRQIVPKCVVIDDKRIVDEGKIVTCAGISAGIDGSLWVVKKLFGEQVAHNTAEHMEYYWDPEHERKRSKM